MKILVVSKYAPPTLGGVETVTYETERRIADKHDVTIIASCAPGQKPGCTRLGKMKIVRLPALHVGPTPISPGVFSALLHSDFDVAHLHEPNPAQNFFAYLALAFKRKPYVVTYHSDLVAHNWSIKITKPFYLLFQRWFLLRAAQRIMPTSPNYVAISDVLPAFKHKLSIVPNGVDLQKFKPGHIPHKGKRVLFVGRLIYYKGLDYFIRAMPSIKKRVPDAHFVIVGDGPLEKQLKQLAREQGAAKDIEWTGALSDSGMIREYKKADVFVLPSTHKTEAFGIVLLDAAACGTPVVTTSVSGTAFAAGDAGLIVPPKDSRALANAIIQILTDKKLAGRLHSRCSAHVKKFEWRNISKMVEKIYARVVSR